MHDRKSTYLILVSEAILNLDANRISIMANAVGWKWNNCDVTPEMVKDKIQLFRNWATAPEVLARNNYSFLSPYSAGFSLSVREDIAENCMVVQANWGLSEEIEDSYTKDK